MMSDDDLVIPFSNEEPESPEEHVIYGEAEAYSIQGNVYYRLQGGHQYKYIWHNNRRLKVEQIVQAQEDQGTDIYLYGVSDDPYPLEFYDDKRAGERYCRPFEKEERTIDVAPELIFQHWNEEAYAYLECVSPKFLSVKRPRRGDKLLPDQLQLGEVRVTLDVAEKIVSVKKKTYVGVLEE